MNQKQQQAAAAKNKTDFEALQEPLNNCVQHTRKICEVIRNTQPFQELDGDPNKSHFVVKNLDEQVNALTNYYNSLETLANELPEKTPIEYPMGTNGHGQPLSIFSSFVNDSAETTEKTQFLNEATDAANYTNYMQTYSKIVSELLNPLTLKTSSLYGTEINIPFSNTNKIERIQKDFDRNFIEFVKKINAMGDKKKQWRILFKFLEQSVTHSIIEFIVESKSSIKSLWLVNNGQIEYVNLYGHKENYTYIDSNQKIVDIYVRSQSEFYSTLTTFLNNQYQAFMQSPLKRKIEDVSQKMDTEMHYIHQLIQKANQNILAPCKVCKKYLREGMPPTLQNISKNILVHPECQGYREQ